MSVFKLEALIVEMTVAYSNGQNFLDWRADSDAWKSEKPVHCTVCCGGTGQWFGSALAEMITIYTKREPSCIENVSYLCQLGRALAPKYTARTVVYHAMSTSNHDDGIL